METSFVDKSHFARDDNIEAEGRNIQKSPLRLRPCELGDSRSSMCAQDGVAAAPPLATDHTQEHNKTMNIKIERDDEDLATIQVLGTAYSHLQDDQLSFKEEGDFTLKTIDKMNEIIKQELDIGPTVLLTKVTPSTLPSSNQCKFAAVRSGLLVGRAAGCGAVPTRLLFAKSYNVTNLASCQSGQAQRMKYNNFTEYKFDEVAPAVMLCPASNGLVVLPPLHKSIALFSFLGL
ncbi:hypothetical protein EVAR_83194_1 [Eumeta japonica]|uniref:Uncharacterized protein n=1 Tax=Eumeta variegata TaxID=151549 RepID=A0A4C1YNW1_EUMVA|nr:hypothetical protein EVAR_83194_1 [Eumeta japonica]